MVWFPTFVPWDCWIPGSFSGRPMPCRHKMSNMAGENPQRSELLHRGYRKRKEKVCQMFSKKLLRKASLVRRFQTSVRCSEKELCKFWSQNPQDPQSSVTATQIPCLFVLGRSSATACRSKLSVRQTWVQKKWNDSNDSSPKWICVDRYIYIHILYFIYVTFRILTTLFSVHLLFLRASKDWSNLASL